jgi:hypothetical protein
MKGRMLRHLAEIFGLALSFVVFLLLAGCDDRPGEWCMIIYPDRTDRTRFVDATLQDVFVLPGIRTRADEGTPD